MQLVGFKRATVGIFDKTGKMTRQFVIQGDQDKGATVSAEITGLSKEPSKVFGSDIAYYVSQKGTGDVGVDFGFLDIVEEDNDEILGYKTNENGLAFIGEDTEPPYCSVLLESSDLSGETALLGFFKGKFSKDGETLNTQTNDAFEPEAQSYKYAAIANDAEGEAKGQTVVKYVGSDKVAIDALKGLVFPAGE
ncbi:major tail protein [Enterococcus durans]|uniref:major tail protein n=1 Tax=Enterococcus durans TaxID=53345 RepID=UPI0011599406|nr:major tail protein [Enterococcus durans]